jgi:hypothetical protein
MDPKADVSMAETVASNSLAGGPAPEISRVSSTSSVHEDEGRFLPGTLLGGAIASSRCWAAAAWARSTAPWI